MTWLLYGGGKWNKVKRMMNSVFKCLMSAVCAVALPAFGQEEKTGFPTDRAVTVFSAGEGNPYASIRIPALLSIGKGQLLAFAEGRYKNTDQGENDIIMSVSKNGGKTWSRPRAIAKAHGANPRQVALAFLTRRPSLFAIPKAAKLTHVEDNAKAGDLTLSAADIRRLDESFPLGRKPRGLPMI